MRSFQERLGDFNARGIRLLAISVDPVEVNRVHRKKMGFDFPLLSDAQRETIRRYDLVHSGAGPNHTDIARPAEFLVDSNGMVRWRNLTENIAVRLRPEQVLDAFTAIAAPTHD